MKENEEIIDTSIIDKIEEQPKEDRTEEQPKEDRTEEQPKEDRTEASFTETINEIKADYDIKIARINAEHEKALKERDNVIKQLLKEEDTAKPLSIVDKINLKRTYKKW